MESQLPVNMLCVSWEGQGRRILCLLIYPNYFVLCEYVIVQLVYNEMSLLRPGLKLSSVAKITSVMYVPLERVFL